MEDLRAIAESLTRSLHLRRAPVAVCLTDEVPQGVSPREGRAPAGCVFWEEGASKVFATGTADHELCAIGVHTHNLAEPSGSYAPELGDVLKLMAGMEYVRDEDVAGIPVLENSRRHVIYAPLAESPLPPDVVILFLDAAQGLVLTEAAQQVDAGIPPAMGRPACAMVPQAINSGRAALSLGCCGARAYVDALTQDVALWALPGGKVGRYAERVERLAAANDTLGRFHERRRRDVAEGGTPTYRESLRRMQP